jgi:hypothetical protein
MKLLLDACVWGGAVNALEVAGHDVVWAGDWPEDPGDDEILQRAHRERRALVNLTRTSGSWQSFIRPRILELSDWSILAPDNRPLLACV